jgi:hypothetical protein
MKPEKDKRTIPWWLKAFFWWHVYAMAAWSLPLPPAAILRGTEQFSLQSLASNPGAWALAGNLWVKQNPWLPLKWYMRSTGLWQYWDMFAPNPMSDDIWLDSVVAFQDGTEKVQPYPRMADLGLVDKYFQERFRKYADRFYRTGSSAKRTAFGQRMALLAATDRSNLPVSVVIRLHIRRVQRFGVPTPDGYETEQIGVVTVDQEKLKKDKGW